MNLKDRKETKQKKWTFRVLYALFFAVICLLFYVFYPLPSKKDNQVMLEEMTDYKLIFDHHYQVKPLANNIKENISGMNFTIKQIQKELDVQSKINKLNKSSNASTTVQPTTFNGNAAKMLRLYFDSRQLLGKTELNNNRISKNLEDCKAFVADGMARAPF